MAHSARDPVFQATLAIANADANESGSFCFRCHAPQAYLTGKGANGTMADFSDDDKAAMKASLDYPYKG